MRGSLSAECSTPGGIETKISWSDRGCDWWYLRVLNARRHRDEDQAPGLAIGRSFPRCSTPGGIETKIRLDFLAPDDQRRVVCSTPGGIETKISFLFSRDGSICALCSTPGGIETKIR